MADAGAGRHHAEIIERALRPFQEFVALLVLPVFFLDVFLERLIVAVERDGDRVIDDKIDRDQRVDLLGIAAERLHRVAHRGEIDHGGNAGEVLHQHARRAEGEFMVRGFGLEPLGDRLDVFLGDRAPVFIAQQVLEENFHRVRQARDAFEAVLFGDREAVIRVAFATNLEGSAAFETVERSHVCCFHSRPGHWCRFGLSS